MQFSISWPSSVWFAGNPRLRKDPLMQVFGSEIKELRLHAKSKSEGRVIKDLARILENVLGKRAVKIETPGAGGFSDLVLYFIQD